MSAERPNLSDYYPELLYSTGEGELTASQERDALEAVRLAMGGVETLLGQNRIANVEISFEVINHEGNVGFNFSAEQ